MTRNQSVIKSDNNGSVSKAHEPKLGSWFSIGEIAKGDLSTVSRVIDSEGKIEAAMKVEKLSKDSKKRSIEKDVLEALRDSPHSAHIIEQLLIGDYRFTVMTLSGPTLGIIKHIMDNKFSDSTILRLSMRTLMAIKDLHEHGFIHRDLEPFNIALSPYKSSRNILLLDFGEARQFARNDNGKWMLRKPRDKAPFRGSDQYCSPRMHNHEEQGRVDDLWSWLYVFVELRAFLPWTDSTSRFKYGPLKRELLDDLLASDPFITTFCPIVTLLREGKYADRPDYGKIYEILAAKMTSMGVKWTDPMDFDLQADKPNYFSKSPSNEEVMTDEQISAAFHEQIVPGGLQYVLPANVPFYAEEKVVKKNKEKEREKEKDKEKEKEKDKEKEKEKEKEKGKDKEKEREKRKSKEKIKEKEKKMGSLEKTTERTSEAPSTNALPKAKPKKIRTLPPKQKHTKTSSTSSVSHQTPPSPIKKPSPKLPAQVKKKTVSTGGGSKQKAKI